MSNTKTINGIFFEYDKPNLNGRIYTKECVENVVKQFEHKDTLMFGTIDPPEQAEPSVETVSHRVIELHINEETKTLEGTIEILPTPKGVILENVINALGGQEKFNENFFMASRGYGKVNEKGEVEDFVIIGFDVVARPATEFLKLE